MASKLFDDDSVEFETKENAVASFDRFLRLAKLWQLFEVLVVLFGLISWSSAVARVPEFLEMSAGGGWFVELSTYLLNHHVVFLFGNAIIVLLFAQICRQNDVSVSGDGHFCDFSEAVRQLEPILPPPPPHKVDAPAEESCSDGGVHFYDLSEAVRQLEPIPPPPAHVEDAPAEESGGGNDEKSIVVRTEGTEAIPPCDCAAEAIEKAKRQIRRFQRTQSERLKREIAVRRRPQAELRRSETENCRKTVSSGDIDNLSGEEFRRRVDAFIKTTKRNQLEEYHNYKLLKM